MPLVRHKTRGRSRLTYEQLPAIVWTQLGGIVWVGVALWITIHLGAFAVTAGLAPARNFGIPIDISNPKLDEADARHLRLGGAISDLQGNLLIDPRVDRLLFVTVGQGGRVVTELQASSNNAASPKRVVAILQPRNDGTYGEFVRALDAATHEGGTANGVWLVLPCGYD